MQADVLQPLTDGGRLSLSAASLRHLPLIREAIRELGIDDVIDELLPADPRMKASDADCVRLMILNVLHGRVALYRMADWLQSTDPEVVLGTSCGARSFSDTRLAETLDRLSAAGTDEVLSTWAARYLSSPQCPEEYAVHTDTTTVKLYGAYNVEAELGAPVPAHGHSKDHRPDLLQLVYGLSVQGAAAVPMCVTLHDGNAPDQTVNRFHIDQLAGLLPPQHDVTLVADGKLCDPNTLGRVLDSAFHFVTLVPRSYNVRRDLVERIRLDDEALPVIGQAHQRLKSDPVRHYRGRSFIAPFKITDPETGLTTSPDMRMLVVASPGLAQREEGVTAANLKKEHTRLKKAGNALAKQTFSREDDANAAVKTQLGTLRFHDVDVTVSSEIEVLKRKQRGRPRKGQEAPSRKVWRAVLSEIRVNDELVKVARFHGRHFVLITDHLDTEAWPDERVLATYREQHVIEGHTGFRWLKGPAAVAPVFLNTPRRIAALGLVFILALIVRNFIEAVVREALADNDETLPNLNSQATARPSAENIFHYFRDVRLLRATVDGALTHSQLEGLNTSMLRVLELLGLTQAIFLPGPWKIGGARWRKARM